MGLSIGQLSTSFTSVPRSPISTNRLQDRLGGANTALSRTTQQTPEEPDFFQNGGEASAQVQGGRVALSSPAALLDTLVRTVDSARETLPTIDEIRIRFQLNATEARQQLEQRQARLEEANAVRESLSPPQNTEIQPVEESTPDEPAQFGSFVETANEVAPPSQDRPDTEAIEEPEPRQTAPFNTESFSFSSPQNDSQFDISV
jgi:hypothetical protein